MRLTHSANFDSWTPSRVRNANSKLSVPFDMPPVGNEMSLDLYKFSDHYDPHLSIFSRHQVICCQLHTESHLVVTASLQGQQYYSHFPDEKLALEKIHNFSKVTQWWFKDLNQIWLTPKFHVPLAFLILLRIIQIIF